MRIILDDMKFHAFHGVLPQERTVGGLYEVRIELETANVKATETDDVNDTINYAHVYEIVEREMLKPSNLIEHVAGRIGRSVLDRFPTCDKVFIKITKNNPPINGAAANASVELTLP